MRPHLKNMRPGDLIIYTGAAPDKVKLTLLGFLMNKEVGWPTTVAAKPKTSRQKQNTSRYLVSTWGFWFCCEVFGFAVRFSVLPWGQFVFLRLLVLPWQLWATVKEDRTRQQSLPAKPRLPPLIRDWEIIKKAEISLSLPSPVVKRIRLIFFADKEILEFAADGLSSPRNFDLTFALRRYQGKQSIR